jgi:hypothetical protein
MAKIKTSSRNPILRLLFVGVALILRNVWVWLHAEVIAQPRRGGRYLQAASLRLNRMFCGLWLRSLSIIDSYEVFRFTAISTRSHTNLGLFSTTDITNAFHAGRW